jgi:beta-lactam-binding protein with PASTA domain
MTDVIGKKLIEAKHILQAEGYEISVIETVSDKQKEWDAQLVVRQVKSGSTVQVTVSNFKLEI